jgi:splicing factor 3A subunit 3
MVDYLKKYFVKTHPLIDFNTIQDAIDDDFEKEWPNIPGWENLKDNTLYCHPCQKTFTNNQVFEYHKKGKAHIKNAEKSSTNLLETDLKVHEADNDDYRECAYYEYQILKYKELMSEMFENTKNLVRKKQSMNRDELEADVIDEKELDHIEFDEEDEKKVYNPKNVPLGWDGKYFYFKIDLFLIGCISYTD